MLEPGFGYESASWFVIFWLMESCVWSGKGWGVEGWSVGGMVSGPTNLEMHSFLCWRRRIKDVVNCLFVRCIDLRIYIINLYIYIYKCVCLYWLLMTSPRKQNSPQLPKPWKSWQLGKALIPLEPCEGQSFAKDSIFVKMMSGRTFICQGICFLTGQISLFYGCFTWGECSLWYIGFMTYKLSVINLATTMLPPNSKKSFQAESRG